MKIFDSHAHYDDDRFNEDQKELLDKLMENEIYIMNVGADMEGSYAGVELAKKYPNIYAAVGVHPHYADNIIDNNMNELTELSKHEKVLAIGEIGLDFYYDKSQRDIQRKWFRKMLNLAKDLDLPVIIHSREADQETFDILKEENVTNGVIHCFSGSKELACEYIKRGFYIGIGGTLTFKNARKTVEVVEAIPLERILIETDAPYLTPVPYRGQRNNSLYLEHVIEKIAQIKEIDIKTVADTTFENAKVFYRLI